MTARKASCCPQRYGWCKRGCDGSWQSEPSAWAIVVLRAMGITMRKTPDLIIGAYCIERGHFLLHDDRDVLPMQEHLGPRVI
jgi:predicted nucleic acid-binding protein